MGGLLTFPKGYELKMQGVAFARRAPDDSLSELAYDHSTIMVPTPEQIEALKKDFDVVTALHPEPGAAFEKFFCPILHEDGFGSDGLMEGHILNAAIKTASRKTVPQRKDIDGYFGETIEPNMINWVNLHKMTPKEILTVTSHQKAIGVDGKFVDVFYANEKSRPRNPQIALRDEREGIIGMPYLKTDISNVPYGKQIAVQGSLDLSDPCLTGSLVKAAHLAMFKLTGYDWVFSDAGRYVAGALARFYLERGTKQTAGRYFAPFRNAIRILVGESSDTLNDMQIIWHFDDKMNYVWGSSALFRINGHTFMATVPRALNWTSPRTVGATK